eukprot:CAMPEP_0181449098 /NCGR_PEP_ID=MMETSP1110-20121109/27481_1 /TAXON_ID=174948 /ORGANISM="Symbiodinium sp., Strain CCMP421" /LENGTH=168 /DNA_ID=CAMNT_0023573269 /DNA_START=147 /DNA_END=653 /DNA_ORIENTATION=+
MTARRVSGGKALRQLALCRSRPFLTSSLTDARTLRSCTCATGSAFLWLATCCASTSWVESVSPSFSRRSAMTFSSDSMAVAPSEECVSHARLPMSSVASREGSFDPGRMVGKRGEAAISSETRASQVSEAWVLKLLRRRARAFIATSRVRLVSRQRDSEWPRAARMRG